MAYDEKVCDTKHKVIDESMCDNKTEHEKIHNRITGLIIFFFSAALTACGVLILFILNLLKKGG